MKTTLCELLTTEQIIADMRSKDRWEAIEEMVGQLLLAGKISEECRAPIVAAVRKRETSMSTGIGLGIGLPHAQSDLISTPLAVVGRSKPQMNFDALDGQPVCLAILLVIPQGQYQKHLHTVANVASLFRSPDFRSALMQAGDAGQMLQIIRERS